MNIVYFDVHPYRQSVLRDIAQNAQITFAYSGQWEEFMMLVRDLKPTHVIVEVSAFQNLKNTVVLDELRDLQNSEKFKVILIADENDELKNWSSFSYNIIKKPYEPFKFIDILKNIV